MIEEEPKCPDSSDDSGDECIVKARDAQSEPENGNVGIFQSKAPCFASKVRTCFWYPPTDCFKSALKVQRRPWNLTFQDESCSFSRRGNVKTRSACYKLSRHSCLPSRAPCNCWNKAQVLVLNVNSQLQGTFSIIFASGHCFTDTASSVIPHAVR